MSKNKSPEKLFEQEVRAWCFSSGIWVEVYDSKAKPTAKGFFRAQGLKPGTPDLLGLDRNGLFHAIELKAPGKKMIPSLGQYQFLLRVIEHGGFAACVNDLLVLQDLRSRWIVSRVISLSHGARLLTESLPKEVYLPGSPKRVVRVGPHALQL